jgi:DNA polymerase-3 subunit delta
MPAVATRVLKKALETGEFDGAYLFHGDDDYLKEEKVRALIERATDPATRDFNVEARRGAEVDGASLALALDALPMMASRRVLVIRDVTLLRKDARAVVERHLSRAAGDLVLVLVAAAGTKPDAVLIERSIAIEFQALTRDHLAKWVAQHVVSLNARITPRAVELLCDVTGSDLALLAGEIEKLRNYADGAEIDESAISDVVGVRRGETLGDLLDLMGERKGPKAIALLPYVLAQPKTSAVSIVMALTTQMLAIGWAVAARDAAGRSVRPRSSEADFYGFLGENRSSTVGRPWSEAVRAWARAVRHWDDGSVDHALALLLAADAALKETRVSSEEQLLRSLLLAMGASEHAHRAA